MKKCKICSLEFTDDRFFCPQCGEKLEEISTEQATSQKDEPINEQEFSERTVPKQETVSVGETVSERVSASEYDSASVYAMESEEMVTPNPESGTDPKKNHTSKYVSVRTIVILSIMTVIFFAAAVNSYVQINDYSQLLDNTRQSLNNSIRELEQVKGESSQTQGELEQARSELEQIRGESSQTQSELEQTQSELQQAQSELKQAQSELKQTQSELKRTQSELEQVQSELQQTRNDFSELQIELKQYDGLKELYGYGSDNYYAEERILIIEKGDSRDLTIYANYANVNGTIFVNNPNTGISCKWGDRHINHRILLTITGNREGLYTLKFTNKVNSDSFEVLVIVTDKSSS